MVATKDNPIVFFDIISKEGPWSPNTWKTRLALTYKRLPYRVEYVSYPDIEPTLKRLGAPATSNNTRYTLPVIADPADDPNGEPTYIADSFNIALYLDEKYPSPTYPRLFPPGTRSFHGLLAEHISASLVPALAPTMIPLVARSGFLDDKAEGFYRQKWETKFGKPLEQVAEEGRQGWARGEVQAKWDALGELLDLNKRTNEAGPFVMGSQISYADLMLVAAFCWTRRAETDDRKAWQEISQWQGGRWGTLWSEVEQVIGCFYE